MKKVTFALFTVLASCLTFVSCSKNGQLQDDQRPVINLESPVEGAVIKIGDPHGVHFEMYVKDNLMLKSYKIEIHNNFDHHEHTQSLRHGDEEKGEPFFFTRTYDLSGHKEAHIHQHDIKIPAGVAEGDYHLMVYVLDNAGNEAVVSRNIVLSKTAGGDGDGDHDHDHDHDHE